MRSARAVAACIVVASALSGCSSLDAVYLREGIGTTLSTTDLPEASYLQDVYVGEICRQAGLRFSQQGTVPVCEEVGMRPAEWATFVQAGMNDIDRRCDAYLAWLDNKRRWREPILKQIAITGAGTAAILGLTGVGPAAISIVGTAFGFAADTFVNFSSRLITEVDHSVVQTVVLDNQNQFRAKLVGVPIDNRPAALYLLRNYLRICMPFSIEMSINNTVTVFHRGGADALRTEPLLTRGPTIARVTAAAPLTAREQLRRTLGPRQSAAGTTGPSRVLGSEDMMKVQALLCLSQDGALNPDTRDGIRIFKETLRQPDPSEVTADDIKLLVRKFAEVGECKANFRNYYERTILPGADTTRQFQKELNAVANSGGAVPESGILDQDTREKIARVRTALGLPETNSNLNTQVTRAFRLELRRRQRG